VSTIHPAVMIYNSEQIVDICLVITWECHVGLHVKSVQRERNIVLHLENFVGGELKPFQVKCQSYR